ncbi:MAG: hypothetical protein ACRCVW_03970 [Brevinema sp.]
MTLIVLILQLLSRRPSLSEFIKSGFLFGGGSYYFLIYLQLWICIPFLIFIQKKWHPIFSFVIVIFIEIVYYNIDQVSDWFNRLCAIRYITLLNLGVYIQLFWNHTGVLYDGVVQFLKKIGSY